MTDRAEDIALSEALPKAREYERDWNLSPATEDVVASCVEAAVQALRDVGLLVDWRTDLENVPDSPMICETRRDTFSSDPVLNGRLIAMHGCSEDGFFRGYDRMRYHSGMFTRFAIISPPDSDQ